MRTLLAVDGSACSDAAVSAVAARPWPSGTEIKIISAFQIILPMSPEAWAISAQYCDQLEQIGREQAQAVVTNAAEKIKTYTDPSISLTTSVVIGSPQTAILEESEDWKADLIVVGSHGYSGLQRYYSDRFLWLWYRTQSARWKLCAAIRRMMRERLSKQRRNIVPV